jgi:hypothetical protein
MPRRCLPACSCTFMQVRDVRTLYIQRYIHVVVVCNDQYCVNSRKRACKLKQVSLCPSAALRSVNTLTGVPLQLPHLDHALPSPVARNAENLIKQGLVNQIFCLAGIPGGGSIRGPSSSSPGETTNITFD